MAAAREEEPADGEGETDGAERRQGRRQAGRELPGAEQPKPRCHQPEEQHRLVEIGQAVEMRHAPAAEREHLPRHLGVAPLVGLEERPAAEPPEEG